MANANISFLQSANTFAQWVITTNNLANSVNELRNGNYYKDGGNFTVANGGIFLTKTGGTSLTVGASAIINGILTSNTIINTGDLSVFGNVFMGGTFGVGRGMFFSNNIVYVLKDNGDIVANNMTINGNLITNGTEILNTNRLVLSNAAVGSGDGWYQVGQGPTLNSASLYWNSGANVWQQSNVFTNVFNTMLSTANLADSITNTSISAAATANSVVWALATALASANGSGSNAAAAYAAANAAANTVATFANGTIVLADANLNFNNTATVNVSATANGNTQTNVAFSVNTSILNLAAMNANFANYNTTFGVINATFATENTAIASAANTVATFANGTLVLAKANLNFNNTSSMNVSVTANGATQSNVAFSANISSVSQSVLTSNANICFIKTGIFSANLQINNSNVAKANFAYSVNYCSVGTFSPTTVSITLINDGSTFFGLVPGSPAQAVLITGLPSGLYSISDTAQFISFVQANIAGGSMSGTPFFNTVYATVIPSQGGNPQSIGFSLINTPNTTLPVGANVGFPPGLSLVYAFQ